MAPVHYSGTRKAPAACEKQSQIWIGAVSIAENMRMRAAMQVTPLWGEYAWKLSSSVDA